MEFFQNLPRTFRPFLVSQFWCRRHFRLIASTRCSSSSATMQIKQKGLADNVQFVIRRARRSDCTTIARHILDLASEEGKEDGPELTAEDLLRHGFDAPTPEFYAMVLEVQEASACEASSVSETPLNFTPIDIDTSHKAALTLPTLSSAAKEEETSASALRVALGNGVPSVETRVIGHVLYSIVFCKWRGRVACGEEMYIHPQYQGLELGKALHCAIMKDILQRGCTNALNMVARTNKRALKFWLRHGWREVPLGDPRWGAFDIVHYMPIEEQLRHSGSMNSEVQGIQVEDED